MRASVWLEQLERYRPDIASACREAYSIGSQDGDFFRPDGDVFRSCPSDSIDYAVMEKVVAPDDGTSGTSSRPECVVLPLDAGWSDVGEWSAVWEEGEQDSQGNVIRGDVYAQSMRNSLLIGGHRLLSAVGLGDVIVVETADAVLVAHKDSVQDVKELVARLKAANRPEQQNHREVHRPWGSYETVDSGPRFQVKRLTVKPGAALSLQMQHHRAEDWVVVHGTAKVTKGERRVPADRERVDECSGRSGPSTRESRHDTTGAYRGAVRRLPWRRRHHPLRRPLQPPPRGPVPGLTAAGLRRQPLVQGTTGNGTPPTLRI